MVNFVMFLGFFSIDFQILLKWKTCSISSYISISYLLQKNEEMADVTFKLLKIDSIIMGWR